MVVAVALTAAPAQAIDFAPPTYTGVWGDPFAIATPDLNGDGHPDLVAGIAGEPSAEVVTLLGNGAGGFEDEQQYQLKGKAVFALTVADLDGDGKLDVAATQDGAPGEDVAVLRGEGNGYLREAPTYFNSGGEDPLAIAAAPFTGKALPDLVVGNSGSNDVALLENTSSPGSVSFAPAKLFAAGHTPDAFAVADFNDDGIPDVAVADDEEGSAESGYTILDGTGTAGGLKEVGFTKLGHNLGGVASGDFNGDGYPDLAFVEYVGGLFPKGAVYVLLNNKHGGFEAPVTYDTSGRPITIATAEIDGATDLLVGEAASGKPPEGHVLVLQNNGSGTFSEAGRFVSEEGFGPILGTDLTGDGAADIIEGDSNGTVATLLDIGQASPAPSSLAFGTVAEGQESTPQTVTVTNTGAAPLTIDGLGLAGADPGDFDLDDAGLVLGAGNCSGVALAAGASCTANVALRPAQTGALAATLLVFTDTGAAPASIALSGAGAPPTPVPAPPPPPKPAVAPRDSALKLSHSSFAPLSHGASIAAAKAKGKQSPRGTRVSYSDTLRATSTFTIVRLQRGYRTGGKGACKAPPAHGKPPGRSASCTRSTKVGGFTRADVAGPNSFTFSGRVDGKPLAGGGYALQVTPKLAALAGKTLSARFTIV
jgi:FG-GAP-like repeat/FG-GAP repeat